jgi:ABC-2 type transport system ATP-binding protein
MEQDYAIRTERLVKHYGKVEALRGLNLQVKQGEIYGFLGPNGAGKTTTIRCLLDTIRPTEGRAVVLGMDPQQDPVGVRNRVGYLPGELNLFQNMKVKSTLQLLNSLRGGKANWDFVQELAGRLKLDLDLAIKDLSKGNKQKVGVIQAFMHRPELLLLDEPTAGLDPLVQQEVLQMVREAKAEGATIFFSSHVLSEVEEIADRVGIIRKGELVEVAEPSSLIKRSILRAHIRFQHAIDPEPLLNVEGVKLLSRDDGMNITLEVEGEMDALVKALAAYPVSRIETELPSLEEIFLVYYKE